jgi:Flp pilus assembly protein TadG
LSRFNEGGRQQSPDRRRRLGRGQTLVEFALVLPLFMLVLMGVIEFGFLFNSFLAVNFASREASLTASEAGIAGHSDCLILNAIEQSIGPPSDRAQITRVEIFRANLNGTKSADVTTYTRGGSTPCVLPVTEPAMSPVPYTVGANGYPPLNRCNRVAGCTVTPSGVDQIGVEVTYSYNWHTPLGSIFGGAGGTTLLINGNVTRMVPVL